MKKIPAFLFVFSLFLNFFSASAQTWISATESNFDFLHIRRIQSGPSGHIYALDEKQRLALIRFDTLVSGNKTSIQASLAKVILLSFWPGYEKAERHFEFSSVSGDGRHVALSVTSRQISGGNEDGSTQFSEPVEELFVLDVAEQRLEFRTNTGKKTSSCFFGQTLRYTEFRNGSLRVMARDPEEVNPRELFLTEISTGKKTIPLGMHLGISNSGFDPTEQLEVRDDINRISWRLGTSEMLIAKEKLEIGKIGLAANSDVEIFRFREFHLLAIQPADSFLLLNPRNGQITGLPRPELKLQPLLTLMDGNVLVAYSRGVFSLCALKDGKLKRGLPVKLLPGFPAESPQLANSGADRLIIWRKSGKQLRFNLRSRSFRIEKTAGSDSSQVKLPVLNSKRFRIRSTRFSGIEDSSAASDSKFAPGIFLNGIRIGGSWTNAVDDFVKLDISEKAGRTYLHYRQPMLMALNPQVKRIWTASDVSSPLQAVKADEDGSTVYTISSNGIVQFRNATNGKLFLSMAFDSSGKEWILWTPSGYFDSSPDGDKLLSWMPATGTDPILPGLFPLGAFSKDFRRPELVNAVMLCRDEKEALVRLKAKHGKAVNEQKRQNSLPAEIQMEFPGDRFTFSGTELNLPYFLIPGRLPLKKIQVYIDGKIQSDYLPDGKEIIAVKPPAQDCLLELIPISAAGEGPKLKCRLHWQEKR